MNADAVLYPTRWDGFGLSILEALHAGPCFKWLYFQQPRTEWYCFKSNKIRKPVFLFQMQLKYIRITGVPVVSTNGWPMNELVEDGHNGILLPAAARGQLLTETATFY